MHMQVGHGLPGGRAIVDADVVARGLERLIEITTRQVDEIEQRIALARLQREEAADMPARNHQGVARRHGKGIPDHNRQIVLQNDPGCR